MGNKEKNTNRICDCILGLLLSSLFRGFSCCNKITTQVDSGYETSLDRCANFINLIRRAVFLLHD